MLIDDFVSAAAGGSPVELPLFWWQGWSSRYYVTSILPLSRLDCREPGTFVLVRREDDGTRTPLLTGQARSISDDLFDLYGDRYLRAIAAGANEIHVNLVAGSEREAADVAADIAEGWGVGAVMAPVPA
ncbi:MAG: hypothetical protein AAF318_05775 [Pseudomonadota bacterium]